MTITVDPLKHTTITTYDRDRNPISSTDADNKVTEYSYDAADEKVAEHRADGAATQTTYWADGTVKEQIDGAKHATVHEYDSLARRTLVIDPLKRDAVAWSL